MAPIGETSNLNLDPLWLLPQQGTYLQKVKATIQDQGYTFSLHVTIESKKIDLVAFNDLYGRLYQLTWEPNSLQWSASQHIPEALKPDNIIADFLLRLDVSLIGAIVRRFCITLVCCRSESCLWEAHPARAKIAATQANLMCTAK